MTEHNIVYDGLSPHNGEYWYRCTKCGKSDWIASYGSRRQLSFYYEDCIDDRRKEESYSLKPDILQGDWNNPESNS